MYHMSFRCYFADNNYTTHYVELKLADIKKWIQAYQFTHPNCCKITVMVWLTEEKESNPF